jgi:hypothetical protein
MRGDVHDNDPVCSGGAKGSGFAGVRLRERGNPVLRGSRSKVWRLAERAVWMKRHSWGMGLLLVVVLFFGIFFWPLWIAAIPISVIWYVGKKRG